MVRLAAPPGGDPGRRVLARQLRPARRPWYRRSPVDIMDNLDLVLQPALKVLLLFALLYFGGHVAVFWFRLHCG